jgi:hypothetical protein
LEDQSTTYDADRRSDPTPNNKFAIGPDLAVGTAQE